MLTPWLLALLPVKCKSQSLYISKDWGGKSAQGDGRERQTSGHHLLREQTQRLAIQPRSEGHGMGKGSSSRPAILLDLVGMMLAREEVLGFPWFNDINVRSVSEVTWLGAHSVYGQAGLCIHCCISGQTCLLFWEATISASSWEQEVTAVLEITFC